LISINSRRGGRCEKRGMKQPLYATSVEAGPAAQPKAFQALVLGRRLGRFRANQTLLAQFVRALARLGFSASAAVMIGRLLVSGVIEHSAALAAGTFLVFAAIMSCWADGIQASAEMKLSSELRAAAFDQLREMSARQIQSLPTGGLVVSMQRHPEAVAALLIGHRCAAAMLTIGPLAAAFAVGVVSWQAALLMMGVTPVMIVFFALVGESIHRRADQQEKAFGRLAAQFADRVRTLPTILANHALDVEEKKLALRLEAYAAHTMGVLRIAFVNAAVIDFFASLSIAMLALLLGLGHLKLAMIPGFSRLELWQSLFILMIAPEYFAPFRQFAEQYHAKADGLAAAKAMDRLLDSHYAAPPSLPLVDCAKISLPRVGLVAIVGPSGAGKSTLLRRLAGLDPGRSEPPSEISKENISWISDDAYVGVGLLGQVIAPTRETDQTRVKEATERIGLLDDELLPGGLEAHVENCGENLSGGQRLRISIARALLSNGAVLADEPTSKLDSHTADLVRGTLQDMARSRLVVVATHDPALAGRANLTIDLGGVRPFEAAA
jgi:ABC-type transport system involved in cytochrome bd biosynthesis fused ATPase/permease subunit